MNRLIIVLLLFCNVVLGGNTVHKLDTENADTQLIDSLVSCVEKYVSYEYGSDTNRTNCSILEIWSHDNGDRAYYFSTFDGFSEDDITDYGAGGLDSFIVYRYSNTLVLLFNKAQKYKMYESSDSMEIPLNRFSVIFLRTIFIETKESCKLTYYDNMKCFTNPSEDRSFSFKNDTCFSLGKSDIWPYEKDSSILYLNYEESRRLYRRIGGY